MSLKDYTDVFKGRENPLKPEVTQDTASTSQEDEPQEAPASTSQPPLVVDWVDVTQYEASYGDRPIVTLTAGFHQAKEEVEKFSEHAIVLRRRVDKERETLSVRVEINSDVIRKGIQDVFGQYLFANVLAKPIVFDKPYYELFHLRKELYEYAEAPERTEEQREHMAVLVDFMKRHLKNLVRMHDRLVPNGIISFDYLETIFRPGTLVVQQKDDVKTCHYMLEGESKDRDGEIFFEIQALNWEYDGTKFGPEQDKLRVSHFTGVRKITHLEVYPLDLIPEKERNELRTYLIDRGHKWREVVDVSHRQYDGVVYATERGGSDLTQTHVSGKVILDYNTFFREQTSWRVSFAVPGQIIDVEEEVIDTPDVPTDEDKEPAGKELAEDEPAEDEPDEESPGQLYERLHRDPILKDIGRRYWNKPSYKLSDYQAMLAPPKTPGFSMVQKIWGFFLVDKIAPIVWEGNAFDKLEIDPSRKRMIKTLVQIHQKSKSTFDDIVAGKGKGLVFLLHGPPGGGKTLTAETISELTQKPLYWVTSGELGTSPVTGDEVLRRVFGLATAWNAIVLLDEADVFLAKRTSNEIERNAFVSIFLRSLEWYQGILFLTTNRPEEFDDAFRSRIHMSLHYPPLDARQRAAIWRNLLKRDSIPASWDGDTFQEFGMRYVLNGREIKNLISTSMAIAKEEGALLSQETIDMVYQINQLGRYSEDSGKEEAQSGTSG